MKTLTTSSKSKALLLALALAPSAVLAGLVGKVHELKGEAFKVVAGKTSTLKVGSDLEEGADILVSDESTITVGDFFDRRHHLSAGSHLTMNDRAVILKKGSLWTQSMGPKSTGQVTTANMLIQAEQGEWVTTYDPAAQRTQLTSISGEVRVASPQEPAFQYAVSAGMFTQAQPKLDDGYPRSPTKLGYESLMKTLALFPGQKSRDAGLAKFQEKSEASRAIASVENAPKKGEITFISTPAARTPASADAGSAQSYFMKKAVKKSRKMKAVGHATTAPVRVIGLSATSPTMAQEHSRKPASVRPAQAPKPSESLDAKPNDFLKSYQEHKAAQPLHPNEVQRLLDDLESY